MLHYYYFKTFIATLWLRFHGIIPHLSALSRYSACKSGTIGHHERTTDLIRQDVKEDQGEIKFGFIHKNDFSFPNLELLFLLAPVLVMDSDELHRETPPPRRVPAIVACYSRYFTHTGSGYMPIRTSERRKDARELLVSLYIKLCEL